MHSYAHSISRTRAQSIAALVMTLCATPLPADDGHWYGGRSDGQWQLVESGAAAGSMLSHVGLTRAPNSIETQSTVRLYGGYQFNELLSVEGAHTSLGYAPDACFGNSSTAPMQDGCLGSTVSMSAVSSVPVADGWKMYGRMGMHSWQSGAPTLRWGTVARESGDYGHVYALGLSFAPAENITLRIESERYTHLVAPGSAFDDGTEAQVQSISLSIHF